MKKQISIIFIIALVTVGCQKQKNKQEKTVEETMASQEGTFGYDLAFLKKYKPVILLTAPDAEKSQAIVVADYQGRVMTSTTSGDSGTSFGWLNYALIKSGAHKPHINALGGEDRFWLSPEGGQFSVYFKKGKPFTFEHWQTPAVIDSEPFEVVSSGSSSVKFRKTTALENNAGTKLNLLIEREVKMLSKTEILEALEVSDLDHLRATAYTSINSITNTGADWNRETGTLGIWILGMFKPSPKTTIVAPFSTEHAAKPLLTSNYFGDIPGDRLVTGNAAVFLKADGKFRSKIGLSPKSAKNVAGSYDAEKGILTIISYDIDEKGEYLKSTWEMHKDPFGGDVLNAYNDGPLEDGSQMGPFYELESSSKTDILKKNEKLVHRHNTFHFEGDKVSLNKISLAVLGVTLDAIEKTF
ncbi:DUF6786 family protein [Dyadobacter sp. LHD-138]|uniref:DUF6786 family protein n=1 Tax=Dyadobacter sp. LHD-138 TaxID=3071413 RepID=UPI0027DF6F00|nr:DUF6786 family protein [Dyadobacter sp. LHD-138]MDQ6478930.1 hypothetical protein [Dyadobacter sp. LHD-138]